MGIRHIAHAFLNWIGISLTLGGFVFFLFTGWEANQALDFQIGQAIGVWPDWVLTQMTMSLVMFGAGAGILWWRLGVYPNQRVE